MPHILRTNLCASVLLALLGFGCAAPGGPSGDADGAGGKADDPTRDSSVHATFLEFEFDGRLLIQSSWNVRHYIDEQLLYTVGQLNGDRSVSRLDQVVLTDVETEELEGGGYEVTYHATMPVAWGRLDDVPEEYELILPRDLGTSGHEAFVEKYGHICVDWGAHDVTPSSMWYYWRPDTGRCENNLDEEDVYRFTASATPSALETTGKYPEYDLVWQDEVLEVVAIFGKYADGATSSGDAGIAAYDEFFRQIRSHLGEHELTAEPAAILDREVRKLGVEIPSFEMTAVLADGRRVVVHGRLVDNVRSAGPEFDEWYENLTPTADFITYNGHSGLGRNIRALAQKGNWVEGQYAIVLMNGCDTYAYVDAALWDRHAEVNEDDDVGTKYLDLVMNAMPSFFSNMPETTMAILSGLMKYEEPETFEDMFRRVSTTQVILVSGEQDNTYEPPPAPEPEPEEPAPAPAPEG